MVWLVFALLLPLSAVQSIELKIFDFLQKARREWLGPRVDARLALIAIDDYSVNPQASPLADVWGRGGWVTRDLWTQQMQFHVDFFQPRVLAYDILFLPHPERPTDLAAEKLAHLQAMASLAERRSLIQRLEAEGNLELENQILSMAEAREAGQPAPLPVFACYFPMGKSAAPAFVPLRQDQQQRLRELALPAGAVKDFSSSKTVGAIQLPNDGIVFSPCALGAINVSPDAGGVVRRVPLIYRWQDAQQKIYYLPSLALVSFLAAQGIEPADLHPLGKGVPGIAVHPGRYLKLQTSGGQLTVPIDTEMRLFLNNTFRYLDLPTNLSYVRVNQAGLTLAAAALGQSAEPNAFAEARQIAAALRNRVVFVAQAFTGSGDIGNFALEESIPNVMAHLIALDNLLRADFLRPPQTHWTLGGGLVLALALAAAYQYFPSTIVTVTGAVLLLLYPLAAAGLLLIGQGIHVLTPMAFIGTLLATHTYQQYREEARRRREVRRLFSSMVSPRVLELMEGDPTTTSLEGRRVEATMFFSDVAGFTSISENLAPQDLSRLLNRYLTPMSDIIINADGYVDKYEGDAIMAVWGVPWPDPDHALKACHAARQQLLTLRQLAAEIQSDTGVLIDIRIGINSGIVSAGNMGSARKFQYTVMGDAVNLAARLEPINKDYGTRCIIGPTTRAAVLQDASLILRRLDRIVVKGKTEPVEISELCECTAHEPWITAYEEGLEALWSRRWDEAEAAFQQTIRQRGDDAASRLQLSRLAIYRQTPPPPDWNGAWVRTSKD